MTRKTVRLPLQLGTSAARSLSISGLIFVPAIALVGWAAPFFSTVESSWLQNKDVAIVVLLLVCSPLAAGFFHLMKGLDLLPTDVSLGDESFTVKRIFSSEMPWRSVSEVTFGKIKGNKGWSAESTLFVRSDDPFFIGGIELAHTTEPVELRSLATVAEALRQYRAWNEKPAKPASTSVELFSCAGCGTTLVPTDGPQVQCSHCDATTRVPDRLRTRVRQHAEASAGARHHLRQLSRTAPAPAQRRARGLRLLRGRKHPRSRVASAGGGCDALARARVRGATASP